MAGSPVFALAQTDRAEKTDNARRVRFALFADNPYSDAAEQKIRQALRRASSDAEFFIHVGDIKGGGESCDDGLLTRRLGLLQQAPRPLFFTPGDNEWTDCHRLVAGSYDPLERLQWLRSIVFDREQSLGSAPIALQNQTAGRLLASPLTVEAIDQQGLPENQRWQAGPCQFVSLSVTGSGHGFRADIDADIIAAHARANQRWLKLALQSAIENNLAALVIACHAEFKPAKLSDKDQTSDHKNRARPYAWFRAALHQAVIQFPGTVILLNGDTHAFTLDHPWQRLVEKGRDLALPSYGIEKTDSQSRMRRFTRIRGIGAPAASGFVNIEVTQPANATEPLDVTVAPRLF